MTRGKNDSPSTDDLDVVVGGALTDKESELRKDKVSKFLKSQSQDPPLSLLAEKGEVDADVSPASAAGDPGRPRGAVRDSTGRQDHRAGPCSRTRNRSADARLN